MFVTRDTQWPYYDAGEKLGGRLVFPCFFWRMVVHFVTDTAFCFS